MKSEHRHELQRNDLGQLALRAKPWFEQHGMQLLAGLVIVLVVVAIGLYVVSQPKADAEGWGRLSSAQSFDEFGTVADKYADGLAGVWARLRMAELSLEDGVSGMFTNRDLGMEDLKKAQDNFDAVLKSKVSVPDTIQQRALLGLARCQEAMSDGDVDAALATYRKLLDRQGSIYEPFVKQRVKELETGGAKEFYAWFHSQKPKPPDFRKPKDGAPDSSMLPGSSLPGGIPDVSLPPPPTKTTPKTEEPTKDEAAKPDEAKKPDETAKPAEAPADAKPDEKAAEKPATNP